MIEEVAANKCGGLKSLQAAVARGAAVVSKRPRTKVELSLGLGNASAAPSAVAVVAAVAAAAGLP